MPGHPGSLLHAVFHGLVFVVRRSVRDIDDYGRGVSGLVGHPLLDDGLGHFKGAFHVSGTVLGDGFHPHRHLVGNLYQSAGAVAMFLHHVVNTQGLGVQVLEVAGAQLVDVIVITDDGDECAVFGAFAVEVALDEGVDDAVHGLGSELALGHIVIVLISH